MGPWNNKSGPKRRPKINDHPKIYNFGQKYKPKTYNNMKRERGGREKERAKASCRPPQFRWGASMTNPSRRSTIISRFGPFSSSSSFSFLPLVCVLQVLFFLSSSVAVFYSILFLFFFCFFSASSCSFLGYSIFFVLQFTRSASVFFYIFKPILRLVSESHHHLTTMP